MSEIIAHSNVSEDPRRQLIEARRLINKLLISCRQTVAYLDGVSALDDKRLRRGLQESIREVDRFMRV
ncbi:MAG: hypothetical protein O3C57_04565 [Verrucomicrobia bacterium]|nr:hypothetical protein [Verrucomicrobiota bacterium]